ncbi:hypothetical protein VNI00_000480 [Paramarasmius palmivorus]|uniref:Uncharacterized protein n=1 Tax=Paramarasmius palmivorus TaxID=297713 RepID=A0AAW0EBF4_9AGAR
MDDSVNAQTQGCHRKNILDTEFNTGSQESNDTTTPPRAPHRLSAIPHVASYQQECFRREFRDWVFKTAEATAGKEVVNELGVRIFMADITFERIIDIFHLGELTSTESFNREVRWRADFKAKYGANIVAIASKYSATFPTPIPPSSTNPTEKQPSKEPVTAEG